jgi:glyoxylase-like metal-dependent hydrolase (beta-lactamase superfamily II)
VARRTWLDRQRFRPQQWAHVRDWSTYDASAGERWMGFDCVRDLRDLPPEILLVPLVGHTCGHAGVAVRTDGRWLLHAGDAYFWHEEMRPDHPRCTPGLRLYQWMMDKDRRMRRLNQDRLRELRRDHGDVTVFCAHDPDELAAFDVVAA